jgi:hypothetical protein
VGLKRFLKKARKALHLPAITLGNVAKVAGAAATGGLGAGALALGGAALKSKLKSTAIGGIKQVLRTKAQTTLAKKLRQLTPASATGAPKATTMPGGAPLTRVVAAVGQRRKRAAARPKKAPTRAKRAPPKGGKDFKALSASWKAAGKPGKWLDWIKSH